MKIHELGHVVLYVTNLERMADFYAKTLGFHEIMRGPNTALFSGGRTHHELLLIEIGGAVSERGSLRPGLYHIGFKIGDGAESLRAVYRELRDAGVTIVGASDHTVTHSLYILDPDGNELELYADVSDAWKEDQKLILSPARPLNFG
jgi:catechol 2,3-dioxygenase